MIAMFVLASAIGCVPASDNTLVGLWESDSKSKGGIGQVLQLKSNGEVLTSLTVLVDEVYRTVSNRLLVAENRDALASQKDGNVFSVGGDVLRQPDGKAGGTLKTRMNPSHSATDSIVGDWRYRHDTGGVAFERYTEDGRFLFRLPMNSQLGCYNVSNATLEMVTPKSTVSGKFQVNGDKLTLTGSDGRSYSYRRSDSWYPIDQIDYQAPQQ